jgi:hypothetical protein
MTKALFLLLLIAPSFVNAQKPLKKKFFGKYEGEIAAYKINSGSQFIDVSSTPISIVIQKKDLVLKVGRNEMNVAYTWSKKDKKTIQIEFIRPIDETKELVILTKKSKEILREGIYPQPKCVLRKVRKN